MNMHRGFSVPRKRLPARRALLALAILIARPLELRAEKNPQPGDSRPNIVFILADDLGINDLSCYGRRDQPTPRLDRLAAEGIRFTAAYCAQPICSPTRAALMTGKAPARLHLTTFLPGRPDCSSQLLLHPTIEQQVALKEETIGERLKAAGYATGYVGKWHLGNKGFLPTDQGFDEYFAGSATTQPSATEGGKGEFELTAHAENFIEAHTGGPFFLYVAHNNPHVPLGAQPARIEKHAGAFNPTYAAMLETLDECVGRLVDKLDALGLTERTLIVFTSDNGGLHVPEGRETPATHNTPYRAGKGFCYEGGLRIPLIVRWKGKIKPGQTAEAPAISTDWPPTLVELAGGAKAAEKQNAEFDGASLASLLLESNPPAPRALYWHFPHYTNQGGRPAGAIREGDWKLIEHYEDGRCELFNLADDPSEISDLAAKQPNRIADLRGKLEKWRRDMGAQENTANPTFHAQPWRELYRDTDVSQVSLEETADKIGAKLQPWRTLMNDVLPRGQNSSASAAPGAGAVMLHARDAKIHGSKLRYEPQPHKDTVGFWTQKEDWVEWTFESPGAGAFEVELLQGCGRGSGGAEVEVAVGDQTLTMQVEETGHFQRFVPRTIGTIKFDRAGAYTLSVKPRTKPGAAVMDLRRVTLRAAE